MSATNPLKILILGGVAGGASAAARARRLSEKAVITILERGPYVSYANCGIPYQLGGVIPKESDLLLQTPQSLRSRFNIDVHVNTEALKINTSERTVVAKDLKTAEEVVFPYDKLILSTGAQSIVPDIPGKDLEGVYTLQTIPDLQKIKEHIDKAKVKHAVVVGGGFIGLEAAENLVHLGVKVDLVERNKQVFMPFDPEMAGYVSEELEKKGINLLFGENFEAVELQNSEYLLKAKLGSGKAIDTDLVILSVGVRPRVDLPKDAGVKCGRWGVIVDQFMQTNVPDIYAVGDLIEVKQPQLNVNTYVALAGPANRQGRIASDHIFGVETRGYRGTIGTCVCQVFDVTCAATGLSQKRAVAEGIKGAKAITVHPNNHAGYYPGASQMALKLIFDADNGGKILGAQAVGKEDGVEKRIDVVSMAIQAGFSVYDLEESELAYAPPYGSAKDPVNMAGFVSSNYMRGQYHFIQSPDLHKAMEDYVVIDVRTPKEYADGHIPGAKNIPVDDLRKRIEEVKSAASSGKPLVVYCKVGFRGYLGYRIIRQEAGLSNLLNLDGGMKTWMSFSLPVAK